MNISELFRNIKKVINILYPLEKQARRAGVIMGDNNFVASHFWSSEPYLIQVGSNCGITAGVKIFTHGGGGELHVQNIQTLIALVRSQLVIMSI